MDDLETPAQRRERHRRWLEGFGFSAEDWRRIRLRAAEVTDHGAPPALDDLSIPWRVMVTQPDMATRHSGRLIGVISGRAVLAWPLAGREHEAWSRRRRAATGPES